MNVLEGKKLIEAINSIFKSESSSLADRKKIIESIIEITNSIQLNHRDNVKNINYIKEQYNTRKIIKEEADNKIKEITEKSALIANKLNDSKELLFEEYQTKYENPISINGFINKTEFFKNSVIYKEVLEFKKEYMSDSFKIFFTFDDSIEKNITQLTLMSQNNNLVVYLIIDVSSGKEINVISLIADTPEKRINFINFFDSEEKDEVLSVIKEEDLLKLDNKEKTDLFLMLYDTNLDLNNAPLYKVFKDGLKEFQNIIKKELTVNNKINNKI